MQLTWGAGSARALTALVIAFRRGRPRPFVVAVAGHDWTVAPGRVTREGRMSLIFFALEELRNGRDDFGRQARARRGRQGLASRRDSQ